MTTVESFVSELRDRGVSTDRVRAQRRVISQLAESISPRPITATTKSDLERFLRSRPVAPGTARKERVMAMGFFEWMYRQDEIDASALLSLRAVRPPAPASHRPPVSAYNRTQLAALRDALASRWPRLDAADAERRIARFREKGTGYRNLRSHAIRLQLEAVISLALDCGLRRREISELQVEDAYYDNEYVVVWRAGRWASDARAVPFTDRSRTALHDWIEFRASLRPDHAGLWLNLWAEPTNREPLKQATFDKLLATYIGKGWTLTRLRSTCAVRWVRAGLRPAELQTYLGVSSVADVLPYYAAAGANVERRIPVLAAGFDSSRD